MRLVMDGVLLACAYLPACMQVHGHMRGMVFLW